MEFNNAFPDDLQIKWNGNLDAFNDYLSWPYQLSETKYQLRLKNSGHLKEVLGYEATAERLESIVKTCHPSNSIAIAAELHAARCKLGPTLFEEILEIIDNNKEYVELILE